MIYGWNGMGFESQISGVESDCSNHRASAVIYVKICRQNQAFTDRIKLFSKGNNWLTK